MRGWSPDHQSWSEHAAGLASGVGRISQHLGHTSQPAAITASSHFHNHAMIEKCTQTLSRIWIEYQIFYNNLNGQFTIFCNLLMILVFVLLLLEEFRNKTWLTLYCFVSWILNHWIGLSEMALIMKHDWLCLVLVCVQWKWSGKKKVNGSWEVELSWCRGCIIVAMDMNIGTLSVS